MLKHVLEKEYRAFRDTLIRERKARDLTQEDVAERLSSRGLDVSQSVISKMERLERRMDAVEFIVFVRALGADPSEVIRDIEQSFPSRGKRRR